MKIYFSPQYTADAYVNLKGCDGIEYDCTVVGVEGLVSLIELHLGIHYEPSTQIERQARWMKCMRAVMERGANDLSEAWSKNALGVSNECLAWRDLLRMAKWSNSMRQPADRFRVIAEADKRFDMPSIGDRILTLLSSIDCNPFEQGSSIHVGTTTSSAVMPIVVELLCLLSENGVGIVYEKDRVAAKPETNLAKVQDLLLNGNIDDTLQAEDLSFRIWEFETANDAYRYITSLPKGDFDLYVLSDGKLLDNTQLMLGQPTSGTTVTNSTPQIAQMFLLGMNLFEYPLNINNLLAWLQLPLHPIKSDLRHALVKVIVETTGFDNDRYHEVIAKYLEALDDDKSREKTEWTLDTFDVRPSAMVDMSQLRGFNNALCDWASQMSAIADLDESKRQQLYAVSTLCKTLDTLLADVTEKEIPYRRLEAAISTLYDGAEFRVYDSQAGSRFTTDCANIVSDTDCILWGDCYNYVPQRSPYDFLNDEERDHFTSQGCGFQSDNDFNRAAIRQLKMPVLHARRRCVIVTCKRSAGDETTAHPIMIQICEGFKKSLKNVIEKPELAEFETISVQHIDNVPQSDCVKVSCPLPMPDHESYSSLNQLIQFPLDYVLEKIARIYTPASTDLKQVRTVKGDVAHKMIETLFVGSADEIAARIKDEFDHTLRIVIEQEGAVLLLPENELDCKAYRSELRECLNALADIIRTNNLTVTGREHELLTNIGLLTREVDPGMKGYVDMVLSDEAGRLYIFDFKWTSSRSYYRELLEKNLALQLAIYKFMLERTTGQSVTACAYFTMPRHEMFTTSPDLKGPNVICLTPENNEDLVRKAINSYRYRRGSLEKGIIDNEEGFELEKLAYMAESESRGLYPLEKLYGNEKFHAYNRFSNYACFKSGILQ